MRIRTIKPGFWQSETIASLDDSARLVFIGLWNYVDDEGRGVDNPALVRAALFPLEDRSLDWINEVLGELALAGLLVRYEVGGKRLLAVRSFREHQKVNRPYPSTLPPPPITDRTVNAHGASSPQPALLIEGSVTEKEMEMDMERDAAREPVVTDLGSARRARGGS